jgi:putative component of membrane protein insertase Oxa1/YidC/SpoIIIJ protein YidD
MHAHASRVARAQLSTRDLSLDTCYLARKPSLCPCLFVPEKSRPLVPRCKITTTLSPTPRGVTHSSAHGVRMCVRVPHSRALFSRSCEAQSLGAPATTLAVRRSRCCAPIFSCCFPAHPTCTRQAVEAGHSAWAAAVGSAMRISRILSCLRWETSALDVLRVLRRGLVLLLLVLLLLLGLF